MDIGATNGTRPHLLANLRRCLEPAFVPEIAGAAAQWSAAIALVVQAALGGDLVGAQVRGFDHWFNRLSSGDGWGKADLYGDEFGLPSVRVARAGTLFDRTAIRLRDEATDEAVARALRLAGCAGLGEAAAGLTDELDRRTAGAAATSAGLGGG